MHPGQLWTILLAGGSGARLRDLTLLASGTLLPKQFCSLTGPTSLARLALARALRISPAERVMGAVCAHQRHWWRRDLPEPPAREHPRPARQPRHRERRAPRHARNLAT